MIAHDMEIRHTSLHTCQREVGGCGQGNTATKGIAEDEKHDIQLYIRKVAKISEIELHRDLQH